MAASRKGFTLIEVLVALGIFGVALVSLPPLLMTTVKANGQARRMTTATSLAQDKLEAIRNTPYAAVTSGQDQVVESGTASTYLRNWTVTTGPTATTKKVTVTVSWVDTNSHQVQLGGLVSG